MSDRSEEQTVILATLGSWQLLGGARAPSGEDASPTVTQTFTKTL
jgi:hypothetical protein